MPKRSATNASAKKGERLVSKPIMEEDTSLDSIPAEVAAAALEAEANLPDRPATKPLAGEVDGPVLKEEKAANYKIPSKVGSTERRGGRSLRWKLQVLRTKN